MEVIEENQCRTEIVEFLIDAREYFRASLETSEYENTTNVFHMTAAEITEHLLQRCEMLLTQCSLNEKQNNSTKSIVNNLEQPIKHELEIEKKICTNQQQLNPPRHEDASYLDMTAGIKKKTGSNDYFCNSKIEATDNTKKYGAEKQRFDAKVEDNSDAATDDTDSDSCDDDGPQIYDVCHVSQVDPDELHSKSPISSEIRIDCPYTDLPAGHLAIQNSPKYGQLQRIEKRLFFDQTKKFFCGILNDWLLCYADGPTTSRPTIMLHLKSNSIDIEHCGEGKRREICFQITTADASKKYVFQANNEVDAKEWIHAIEAAIRGNAVMKNSRKLPTPPVFKKMTFINAKSSSSSNIKGDQQLLVPNQQDERLYEEPSTFYPISNIPTDSLKGPPVLQVDQNPVELAMKFEYDVPKSPPQAVSLKQTDSETEGLLNTSEASEIAAPSEGPPTKPEKLEFQIMVKDLHSKLTSQLVAGLAPMKTYTGNCNKSEAIALTTTTTMSQLPLTVKDRKKQKKLNLPRRSPQKDSNSHNDGNEGKAGKNWFLNRLSKSANSVTACSNIASPPSKCKQSEKENLLNNIDMCDSLEMHSAGSNSTTSKVNMIINQFEASGFSMEALASNFSAFCDSDCNNYEPIITVPQHRAAL